MRGVDFLHVVSTSFKRLGQSELLPRYIFAESLYARRRVLEIGAVASTLGQSARFLSTRGARVVVAADSDLQAIQDAQAKLAGPNLRFRPPVFDDFEAGSFDLVMVADLAPYVVAPELLKDLARLVAKGGYLMGGLRNPAGLALSNVMDPEEATPTPTYGQLLDALSVHFKSVEVATQSPVLGYQLAFERGEGLQVDGSLAGTSEAAYFIVVAGQEPARAFDPTWVQLPPEPLAFTGGKLEDFSARARDWRERSERMKDALQKKTIELETRQADLRESSGQLEATKEAVARLTAQLESHRERPETLRDREELAQRVRRLEAELTVLRERAIDAEGRATAAKSEHDALARAQKDAAITTLASQEQIRLERARREEVATQLEDARTRLARAYEELKKAQEDVVTERLERERALSAADRVRESMSSKETDLEAARQRELALADARTQSLLAIEGLERSLAEARTQVAAMRDESSKREADRLSLSRSFEVESTQRRELEKELQRELTKTRELELALAEKQTALNGLETELQSAASAHARASRDIETLSSSERTWRDLAGQYEQRLTETNANVQQLSDQLAQLSAEKESEVARGRRLERDLETAITAERTSREQADVLSGDLRRQITEVTQDRDRLIEERDDLRGAVDDLRKARQSEQQRVAELEDQKAAFASTISKLEAEVAQARREHDELIQSAAQQQRTLQGLIVDREAAIATEKATTNALRQQVVGLDAEVARLGGMLREGQKILDETRASLEARSKDVEAEHAEAAAVRRRIELLEGTLGQATDALEQTSATLDATRSEKNALQHRLDETTLRATGLSDQVQNLQRITLAADEALAAAKSQRNALDRDLAGLRHQTETERKDAEQRYQSLKHTAEASANRAAELEGRFGEVSAQLREQGERNAQQKAELERLANTHAEATRAAVEREQRLALDLERERTESASQRKAVESLEAELSQLRDALERRTTSFNEVQAALTAVTDTLGAREQAVAALIAEREALSGSATAQQTQLAELTRTVSEREAALVVARQAAQELEQAREGLAAQLVARDQRVSELTSSSAALQASLDRLTAERASLILDRDGLSARLSAERDSVSAELIEARRQAASLGEELEHLKAELEETAIARERIVQLRDTAETERSGLAEVLAARTAELEKAALAREQLRESAEAARHELEASLAARTAERQALEETLAARTTELEKLLVEREGLRESAEAERRALQTALAESAAGLAERTAAVDEARKSLEAREASWEQARAALVESQRRELEATTQAATRALDARQGELEAQLVSARADHAKAIEQQAAAYQVNLEQRSADAARALAAREDELLQRNATSEAKLNELERQRDEVKTSLEQAKEAAAVERAEAQARVEAVRVELEQARADAEKGHSEARGHQAGKHALQLELDRSRVELDQLRTSLAQAGGESRAIAEARAQLEGEVERLRVRVPALEAEIGALRATHGELGVLRERVPGLEQSLAEVTQRALEVTAAHEALAKTAASAEAELGATRAQLAAVELSQAEAEARAGVLQQQVLDAETRAVQLADSLSLYQDERPALGTEITELRLKVNVLERQLAEAERAGPQSDAEVDALRRRLPELEAEIEIARVNAKNDTEAAVTARRQAEELLLALRVKYGELQHELATALETIEQSKSGAPDLREQVIELTAENELIEAERERLSEAVESLERRLKEQDQLRDRLLRVETDLELTRKLLDQARRDLDAARAAPPPRAPVHVDLAGFDEESVTAVNPIPDLAALLKQTAPKAPPAPPISPPIPPTDPEVFELEVADEEAEEILLLDEETGENGTNGNGKK